MSQLRHRALIVEDDLEVAEDLRETLNEYGFDAEITTNRRDALLLLEKVPFCVIVLDLQIKAERDSSRAYPEHGKLLLTEARARFPQPGGKKYSLPIVILSGFASETEVAVELMRNGASDVVQKLSSSTQKGDRIYRALEEASRTSHARCEELAHAAPAKSVEGLVLSVPAKREGRRALVTLGGRAVALPMASLKVLLLLVEGSLSSRAVHKVDLGGSDERGFKQISTLREALKVAYDGDLKALIINNQDKHYSLAEFVSIGEVNVPALAAFGEAQISNVATRIGCLLKAKEKFPGKA